MRFIQLNAGDKKDKQSAFRANEAAQQIRPEAYRRPSQHEMLTTRNRITKLIHLEVKVT